VLGRPHYRDRHAERHGEPCDFVDLYRVIVLHDPAFREA
jgi:hypothetical protein